MQIRGVDEPKRQENMPVQYAQTIMRRTHPGRQVSLSLSEGPVRRSPLERRPPGRGSGQGPGSAEAVVTRSGAISMRRGAGSPDRTSRITRAVSSPIRTGNGFTVVSGGTQMPAIS